MSSELGTLAQRYLLESLIAQGGMAAVWAARDDVLARTVAVKILHPHLASDETFLERFRGEALAAARLSHPNIVSIYDTGAEETPEGVRHYIVMEHCGGGTLAGLSEREGPLPPERAVAIAGVVCDALAYAHDNAIVHRDVKPANVLITEDGTIKVADFGIAKAAEIAGDVTTTGAILGTVSYLSPEQARGDEPDARSDLYSVGVLLYELLVGRPPFAGETHIATAMMHMREPPPAPRSLRGGIPKAVEAAVLKALEKDPNDRYQSASEMRAALAASPVSSATTAVFERPRVAPAPPAERDEPHGPSALRWVLPVVLLIALAVGAAFLVPSLLDENEADPERSPGAGGRPIEVMGAEDFDPESAGGDGEEHSNVVPLAYDGDPATFWDTEDYLNPLSEQPEPKDGVGILFDLGAPTDVSRVRIRSATPGYSFELRAGDQIEPDAAAFALVDDGSNAPADVRLDVDARNQYWLVWITELPPQLTAQIAEVQFFGP